MITDKALKEIREATIKQQKEEEKKEKENQYTPLSEEDILHLSLPEYACINIYHRHASEKVRKLSVEVLTAWKVGKGIHNKIVKEKEKE